MMLSMDDPLSMLFKIMTIITLFNKNYNRKKLIFLQLTILTSLIKTRITFLKNIYHLTETKE